MKQIVFGSYNFELGGLDNGNDARLRRQLAKLKKIKAGAWAFQECSNWQDTRTRTQHRKRPRAHSATRAGAPRPAARLRGTPWPRRGVPARWVPPLCGGAVPAGERPRVTRARAKPGSCPGGWQEPGNGPGRRSRVPPSDS